MKLFQNTHLLLYSLLLYFSHPSLTSTAFVPNEVPSLYYQQQLQRSSLLHVFQQDKETPYQSSSSRRKFLSEQVSSLFFTSAVVCSTQSIPAYAEFIGSTAMISKYPDLQYLVPIVTFNSALTILSKYLDSNSGLGEKGVRAASKIIDNFFSGGILSNKNVLKGLSIVYCNEIKYDDPYKERVKQDRDSRLQDFDIIINSLNKMQEPLKVLVAANGNTATPEILAYLDEAKAGMISFLDKVPPQDLSRVNSWMNTISTADVNHNGKLEGEELINLSTEDLALYKAVGDFVGT